MKKEQIDIEIENSIGPWLGKTAKIVGCHLHEEFERAGLDITKEQMLVLKKLDEHGDLSQNDLAELIFRDKSSLTRLLTTIERKGYIRRLRSLEDQRVNLVHLTNKGKLMWEKTKPVVLGVFQRMRSDLTVKEIDQFIETLKKIQGSLKRSETARLT